MIKLLVTTMCIFAVTCSFGMQNRHSDFALLNKAKLLSPTDYKKVIEFKVWLRMRNEKKLQQTLHDLYTPGSKIYHQFLTPKQAAADFFPTEVEFSKVKNYFTQQGFKILTDDKKHLYIRMQGTIAQIERTFHINMNNYQYQGKTFYANDYAPLISKEMSAYVSNISGLTNYKSNNLAAVNKCTGNPPPIQDSSLYGVSTTLNANLVDASGNVIVPNMAFTGFLPQGTNNRGYTPAQIQHAYGVDQLITQTPSIDGTGQTVVIVDVCESPTFQADITTFVTQNVGTVAGGNLPQFVISPQPNPNLFITYPSGGSPNICNTTTQPIAIAEVTLDVEGFHTIAPGAIIYLALAPSGSEDVNTVLSDVVTNIMTSGGTYPASTSLISMSYSQPENSSPTIIETSLYNASVLGLSVDISSGDCGDNTGFSEAGNQKSVNYPSSSPWVTAVGATGLFLDTNNNYLMETNWGNQVNTSYSCYPNPTTCNAYTATYSNQGFSGGSTGGISKLYTAQSWQQNAISSLYAGGYGIVGSFNVPGVPGSIFRAVPDIAMYGDFFPGFEIYLTKPGSGSSPEAVGTYGTSLATPFFTGILALVNQERQILGKGTLGLASQYLYDLPAGALHTINNPRGFGNPIAGVPNPNAFQLFQLDATSGTLNGIIFNFDTSLTAGPIWNDSTGVGTPYAPIFVPTLANK